MSVTRRVGDDPLAGWLLAYDGFDPAQERLREALCALGNGYVTTRGAAPESPPGRLHYPGTYIAGCYDRLAAEIAGRAVEHEDLVNMPDWLPLTFRVDGGPWFTLEGVLVLSYRQELDLRRGVLTRDVRFRDDAGRVTRLRDRRLVSMASPHLAALETTVTPEDWSGRLEVRTALDGRVVNALVARYQDLPGRHLVPVETAVVGDDRLYLKVQTRQSEIRIAEAARTRAFLDGRPVVAARRTRSEPAYVAQEFDVDVSPATPVVLEKVAALYTSRDRAISECGLAARTALARAPGFATLLAAHARAWEHLWRAFGMDLEIGPTARTTGPWPPRPSCACTSSTSSRRSRRTAPTSTSASPPAASPARRTGDTSSGTSCSSSRSSTCGCRRSPARSSGTATAGSTRPAQRPGTRGTAAPCSPGRAGATGGKRRPSCT
jgi:alpha,alpha-trehalase